MAAQAVVDLERALDTAQLDDDLGQLLKLRSVVAEFRHRIAGGRSESEAGEDVRRYLAALESTDRFSIERVDIPSLRLLHAAVVGAKGPTPIRVTSVAMRANVPGARLRLSGAVPPDVIPRLEALQRGVFINPKLGRFEKIALGYLEIVRTHPFDDGNGRLSRLFLTLLVANEFHSKVLLGITNIMRTNFRRYHAMIRSQNETVYAEWLAYLAGAVNAELHAVLRFDASLRKLEDSERSSLLSITDDGLGAARSGHGMGILQGAPLRGGIPERSKRFLLGLLT